MSLFNPDILRWDISYFIATTKPLGNGIKAKQISAGFSEGDANYVLLVFRRANTPSTSAADF